MKCPFQTITTTEVTKNVLIKGMTNRKSDITTTTVLYADCIRMECPFCEWDSVNCKEKCKRVKEGE